MAGGGNGVRGGTLCAWGAGRGCDLPSRGCRQAGRQAGKQARVRTPSSSSTAPPLPQGGETRLTFVNNHLSYAFTWFGLAAALAGVFGVYAYGRLRAQQTTV